MQTAVETAITNSTRTLFISTVYFQHRTNRFPTTLRLAKYTVREDRLANGQYSLKPYQQKRQEITVEGDCHLGLLYLVYIATTSCKNYTACCSRMKSFARSYVWWPGMDKDIENVAKACLSCQSHKHTPPPATLHPWTWPNKQWYRIHIYFAGPFLGKSFFVVVDAHSKWPEIFEMSSTTTAKTIVALRHLFAAYGLPEKVVSDNGPQFIAEEFTTFLKENGVKHIHCAPYHPASNGAVERFVQTLKNSMKASVDDSKNLQHRLTNFLLSYRVTLKSLFSFP